MTIGVTCVGAVKQRPIGDFVDRTAVPPVAEYQAWVDQRPVKGRHAYDAQKLRRAVIMRRRAEPWSTIDGAVGMRGIKRQVERLPEELR